ncbi:twin-arginine translocase TatA/TatE family subunit [Dongia sp. agr-C8]
MGSFSIWHLLIVLAVVLVLFGGRGKISNIMGDFAQGINAFKKGLKNDKDDVPPTASSDRKPTETIERG